MAEQLSFQGFVTLIEQMTARRETGTLFVRTDSNRSVVVGIEQGEIVALTAGPKRGAAALPKIVAMSNCSLRRDDSVISFHARDLPSTPEILRLLKQQTPTVSVATGSIDTTQVRELLCQLLHDYLGPVAPMVCDEVLDHGRRPFTVEGLAAIIAELGKEIDSMEEAREFEQRAHRDCSALVG
jgi:hypothetical protein